MGTKDDKAQDKSEVPRENKDRSRKKEKFRSSEKDSQKCHDSAKIDTQTLQSLPSTSSKCEVYSNQPRAPESCIPASKETDLGTNVKSKSSSPEIKEFTSPQIITN